MTALLDRFSRRIPEVDVEYRAQMMATAARLPDVIALGAGDPDFHTPAHIVEAARKAIAEDRHHYAPPAGMPELRAAIARRLAADFGLDYGAEEIIVTAGAQEAVMLALACLIEEGDEVLLPAPRFTSYDTAVAMLGGRVVDIATREEDGYATTPEAVMAALSPRSKVLVLITPNNPTGAVTPPDTIRRLAELAIAEDLIVIADEIYARLLYDGARHLSIATLPGMRDRTITLNGFSKAYAMTGWRVGYLCAPEPVARRMLDPRHSLSIAAATPSQHAALAAADGPQEPVDAMVRAYAERRTLALASLDDLGMSYGRPDGAFYAYVDVSRSGLSAADFCRRMLEEARVLAMPGTVFADPAARRMRLSFLQPLPRMAEAFARIRAAGNRLTGG